MCDFTEDPDLDTIDYYSETGVPQQSSTNEDTVFCRNVVARKKPRLQIESVTGLTESSDNKTENEIPVLVPEPAPPGIETESGDELTSAEKALGIDLILEEILSHLTAKDLLSTRLLSHRWNYFSGKELCLPHRTKKFKLSFGFGKVCRYSETDDYWQVPGYERNLRSLTELLSTTRDFSDSEFPCSFFNFYLGILSNRCLQSFLSCHGLLIKKLEMSLNYSIPDSYKYGSLIHVKKLLCEQCTNLQHLKLRIIPFKGQNLDEDGEEIVCTGSWDEPLTLFPEKDENKTVLKNLRIIEMWGGIHQEILQGLLEAAVNLQEVRLDNENIGDFLRKGRNRIHLLKKLTFDLDYDGINTLELIASQPNLQLEKFTFQLNDKVSLKSKSQWPRITGVLSGILFSSCNTIQKLEMDTIGVLPGLAFPIMHKLTKVKLVIEGDLDLHWIPRNQYFFPEGFNLAHFFPKVRSIHLVNSGFVRSKLGVREFFKFKSSNQLEVEVPVVQSVTDFRVQELPHDKFSERELNGLRQLFPNAHFTCSTE